MERNLYLGDYKSLGLVIDESIVLDIAALRLSGLDYPDRPLNAPLAMIRQLAYDVERSVAPNLALTNQAVIIEQAIMSKGFKLINGPQDRSSDLLRMLDLRQGNELALAIIYVGAARRAGLCAAVMAVVSGVVIRLGSDERSLFIGVGLHDGFGVLDRDTDRTAYVVSPYPPLSNRMTLAILMDEEATHAIHSGDLARAATLYDRICAIAPSHHQTWWKKAFLEKQMGKLREARRSFSSVLEMTRNEQIRQDAIKEIRCLSE